MDDGQLIEKFLKGDQSSFERLVKKYQDRIYNTIHSIVGNQTDAWDIAQEVFIKAYRSLPSFRRNSNFYTWLYRIAVNQAHDFFRKKKREKLISLGGMGKEEKESLLSFVASRQKTALEELEAKELQELIRTVLNSLSIKHRTIITLREIEGLSYSEIAEALGCSLGTVESRLYRARKEMRALLRALDIPSVKLSKEKLLR